MARLERCIGHRLVPRTRVANRPMPPPRRSRITGCSGSATLDAGRSRPSSDRGPCHRDFSSTCRRSRARRRRSRWAPWVGSSASAAESTIATVPTYAALLEPGGSNPSAKRSICVAAWSTHAVPGDQRVRTAELMQSSPATLRVTPARPGISATHFYHQNAQDREKDPPRDPKPELCQPVA
jgi:hypothetical protein